MLTEAKRWYQTPRPDSREMALQHDRKEAVLGPERWVRIWTK